MVFLMSGVCVVPLRWGGRFVPAGGGAWREGGGPLDLGSALPRPVRNREFRIEQESVRAFLASVRIDDLPPTCVWVLAAEQLQLEGDSLVPQRWIDPHKPGLDRGDEVISHLVQVIHVALKNLPINGNKLLLMPQI